MAINVRNVMQIDVLEKSSLYSPQDNLRVKAMKKGGKKEIKVNGVTVGEFEATGDPKADAKAAQEILKEKGLYKEISKTENMHRQANSFASTANTLYEQGLKKSPFDGNVLSPFIVNATFSIELYLKTLHSMYEKEIRGHDPSKIYMRLPEEAKHTINVVSDYAKTLYKVDQNIEFLSLLQQINNAFEQWRYIYEYNELYVEVQSIRFMMHTLHESCCQIRKSRSP